MNAIETLKIIGFDGEYTPPTLPALSSWNLTTGGITPHGIAYISPYFYIVDVAENTIVKLNSSFVEISSFAITTPATGLTTDGTYLFTCDNTASTVRKWSTAGDLIETYSIWQAKYKGIGYASRNNYFYFRNSATNTSLSFYFYDLSGSAGSISGGGLRCQQMRSLIYANNYFYLIGETVAVIYKFADNLGFLITPPMLLGDFSTSPAATGMTSDGSYLYVIGRKDYNASPALYTVSRYNFF